MLPASQSTPCVAEDGGNINPWGYMPKEQTANVGA